MTRPDGAARLLAAAVTFLPAHRRQWGTAMQAELADLAGPRARWQFAAGCAGVVATRPAVLRRAGYPLLTAAVLGATLWWTGRIAYPPLHWGAVTAVVVLLGLAWLGRRRGPFGPVADAWPARGARAGGYLLLGGWTAALLVAAAGKNSAEEQARYGVPIFTVLLTSYLIGFLTLTAKRSAASARVLTAGLAGGGGAAAIWAATVVLRPPIPVDLRPALTAIALGMAAAAVLTGGRSGATGRLLAVLYAGTVASTSILSLVVVLSVLAGPGLIPDLAPAALTPADALAQSRIELQDPYLWILLLGGVVAALQSAAALAARQRPPATPQPAAGSCSRSTC